MNLTRSALILVTGCMVALAGCGTSSSSKATSTPIAKGGVAPIAAVKVLLQFPPRTGPCYPAKGVRYSQARGCPVTVRLQRRLHRNPFPAGNPICRCRTTPTHAVYKLASSTRKQAFVNTRLVFKTRTSRLTFRLVSRKSIWRVAGINCTGNLRTSIYISPVRSC